MCNEKLNGTKQKLRLDKFSEEEGGRQKERESKGLAGFWMKLKTFQVPAAINKFHLKTHLIPWLQQLAQ